MLKFLEIDEIELMKFAADRPFAEPTKAAHKLIEIASTVESVQDGRIPIELINMPFLQAGGSADEYRAGMARAIASGWLWRHESGVYVSSRRPAPICSLDGSKGLAVRIRRTDRGA